MEAFLKGKKLQTPTTSHAEQKEDSSGAKTKGPVPWVEKYRPKTVDDVAMQDEVVAVLKKSLQGADLPNLLFYGPPGTGKTSTILALSRELFGEMYRSRILELNASDERGIDVVRKKVKGFAQQTAGGTRADGLPCPPFKIIILDEADSMTKAAQAALRRTMEKESRSTRFCLICNYVSRIIEPLTSRCSKFRFKPLSHDVIVSRLKMIGDAEGVHCKESALSSLVKSSEGDMRRAITMLQSVHRLRTGEKVSWKDVLEVAGVIPEEIVSELLECCKKNSFSDMDERLKGMFLEGYSASQMLTQLHEQILDGDLEDLKKAKICTKIAQCDNRLLDGGDEYLQIMDLCCVIMKQFA